MSRFDDHDQEVEQPDLFNQAGDGSGDAMTKTLQTKDNGVQPKGNLSLVNMILPSANSSNITISSSSIVKRVSAEAIPSNGTKVPIQHKSEHMAKPVQEHHAGSSVKPVMKNHRTTTTEPTTTAVHDDPISALKKSIMQLEENNHNLRLEQQRLEQREKALVAREDAIAQKSEKINTVINHVQQEKAKLEQKEEELRLLEQRVKMQMEQLQQQNSGVAQEDKPFCRDKELFSCVDFDKFPRVPVSLSNKDLEIMVQRDPAMEYLDLTDCSNLTDFSAISNLHKLKGLKLGNTAFDDLNIISQLGDLEFLDVRCTQITGNLNALADLTNLKKLVLWGNINLRGIKAISRLKKLRFVDLELTSVEDPTPLAELNNLTVLFIDYTKIKDLAFLDNLRDLKALSAEFLMGEIEKSQVENFSMISRLRKLVYLNISSMFLKSFKDLSNLTRVKEFVAKGNRVIDLEGTENMQEMRVFDCGSNPFENVQSLAIFKKAAKIRIPTVQVEDLSSLRDLNELAEVNISENRLVKDLSFLYGKHNLEELYISKCDKIKDLSPIVDCADKMRILDIVGCFGINNLGPIKYLTKMNELHTGKNNYPPSNLSSLELLGGMYCLDSESGYIISKVNAGIKRRRKVINYLKSGDFDESAADDDMVVV